MPAQVVSLSEARRNLLEKYLRGNLRPTASPLSIGPRNHRGPSPLSFGQEAIWLRARSVPDIPLYNEPVTIHRTGPLDVAALERSFNEVVRRHEAWRTTFHSVNGNPVQVVEPSLTVSLPVLDLCHLPMEQRGPEALKIATEDARQPFDLAHGPLFRARLIRLTPDEHRLFLTVHQIILDGVSVYHVLLRELTALYAGFAGGLPSSLAEPRVQFSDFAEWQRTWLQSGIADSQLDYWRKRLAGGRWVLEWPKHRPRPAAETFRGAIQPFVLPTELSDAVRELGRSEGVTLFVTALAAFVALLQTYTGQNDITVGTVAPAGRERSEVQDLLGYFLNPVPLRFDLSGNPSFRELLRQGWEVTSGALSNDDVPFEYLVDRLHSKRDPSRNPFFQVAISQEPSMPDLPPGWSLTPMDAESGGARWDLYLVLDDRRDKIIGRAQYNPDLFERAEVVSMLDDLQQVLNTVALDPERHLSDLGCAKNRI